MALSFRKCLDGHRCENGSSCAEHPTKEGQYYCDCNTSGGDYAGLFCEYEAETYCQLQQETASNWFCSNQGTCVLNNKSESQWNCDCPPDFEGPHCQFIKGNVPRDWPGFDFDPATGKQINKGYNGDGGLHIAISIFIGVAVVVFLSLVGFFVMRKIRNRTSGGAGQNSTRDHSEAMNKLEADGSVLQEIMQSFARTPNSTVQHDEGDDSIEVGMYSDHPRNGRANGNML